VHGGGIDDRFSAHTHVVGSGRRWQREHRRFIRGRGPRARLFFQAVSSGVNWKAAAVARAGSRRPRTSRLPASGLYGLPTVFSSSSRRRTRRGRGVHYQLLGALRSPEFPVRRTVARRRCVHVRARTCSSLFAGQRRIGSGWDGIIDTGSISPRAAAKNATIRRQRVIVRGPDAETGVDRRWMGRDGRR
jgi:hypothetical protein